MQWLLNSNKNSQRNTRSKMEFESWSLSENLVERFSVGLEISSKNKSTISKRVLLWLEWRGKFKFYRLSLMLKLPVMIIILWILTSVFYGWLRWIKINVDQKENRTLIEKQDTESISIIKNVISQRETKRNMNVNICQNSW